MGPEASRADAETVEAALRECCPGVHPSDLPPDTFRWLRGGTGSAPSASVLLGLFNDMTDSRKGDLIECAKVISMAA
jgi:hypothetical protein